MRRRRLTGVALVVLTAGIPAGAQQPGDQTIAVVVGRGSFVREVSRDDLRELYLRRQRLWPNGTLAVPVNLPAGDPLREGFSKLVLGRSVRDLVAYWNARYFEGIRPPIILPSPAAVRAYVAAEPAAVGYLPVTEVDRTCRVLLRLPD